RVAPDGMGGATMRDASRKEARRDGWTLIVTGDGRGWWLLTTRGDIVAATIRSRDDPGASDGGAGLGRHHHRGHGAADRDRPRLQVVDHLHREAGERGERAQGQTTQGGGGPDRDPRDQAGCAQSGAGLMAWFERLCDAALEVADRLHIFRRNQLDEWQHAQHEAEDAASRIHEANARDIQHMSPDERQRLPNRLEDVYLRKRF